MHWHSPFLLWLLWLLPVVGWLLIRAQRKRQAAARNFAAGNMRVRLLPETRTGRNWAKGALLISGLAMLIVAAARPQYGVYYEQITQRGVDLFVLLDVSRSMLAEDIAPNRLERAKSDVLDLLERIPRDRVGLIVFAGKPILHVPLTNDHAFFRYMLREVDTDSAPIGGSLIGDAIRQALTAMEPRSDRDQVIVLITDGEDHDSFPTDAAKTAAERGVKIIAVGLGDVNEGARIPVRGPTGSRSFVKEADGSEHWSKMREELLKELALATSGAYIPAQTMAYDLGQIYDDHLAGLTRGEIRTEKRRRFREQFQWFTALGLAMLIIDWTLVRFRPRAAAALALLISSSLTSAALADGKTRHVRDGLNAFNDGEFSVAAESFAAASAADPDDPRITFNEGCAQAAHQAGEEARDLFYKSALARDPVLSADSHYNLGCLAASEAQLELGEDPLQASPEQRESGIALLTRAAGHYRDALRMNTDHADARHNLETIRLWIKQMQALWKERDREQQRNEQNLVQMLKDLDARQSALRSSLHDALRQPASPLRQQQLDEIQEQQRDLVNEIEPLKKKISTELSMAGQSGPAGGTAAGSGAPPDDVNRVIEILNQWADGLHDSFLRAANDIAAENHAAAGEAQRESLETINQMYVAIAPFPDLLQTAIASQKRLVEQAKNELGADDDDVESAADDEEPTNHVPPPPEPDPDELAWQQHRIGGWADALEVKATQQLPVLQQQMSEQDEGQATENAQQQDDEQDAAGTEPAEEEHPPDQVSQLKALIESLQRAVELAPQVQTLAMSAADLVRDSEFQMALPKQEQALKLLEEIAEPLSKQEQSQQQQQNQQPNQDPQQGDSQQQQQDDQNSQQQNEPQQQDQQQQDAGRQPKQDEQQDPGQQGQDDKTDPSLNEMTPAQAEAILQRARDRERQHRQIEKQIRRLLRKSVTPERDW